MSRTEFASPAPRWFWALMFLGALVALAGLAAAHYMEVNGHVVTGMDNQVVWGLPHVFAIFMIVAASGVLNVASVGSVFGKSAYKARAPLSGLMCIALLAGGLTVLMLDLGRPDRLIVAATHYNLTSVFAWNVLLYSGMFALVAVYMWTLMEKHLGVYSRYAGLAVFAWRLVLTTGTGAIFAFLGARQAYGTALLPPLFIAMSFAWGLAAFLIVQAAMYAWNGRTLPPETSRRMRNLLGLFVAGTLYFTLVYHLTNAYFARQVAFERFILIDGGIYPALFWWGYVLAGSLAPMVLIYHPRLRSEAAAIAASALVLVGAFALLYVFIIGGQAWPLEIFPDLDVTSSFGDGQVAQYIPRLPELLLGLGGIAIAFLVTLVGVRVLPFLPEDDHEAAQPAGQGD